MIMSGKNKRLLARTKDENIEIQFYGKNQVGDKIS